MKTITKALIFMISMTIASVTKAQEPLIANIGARESMT